LALTSLPEDIESRERRGLKRGFEALDKIRCYDIHGDPARCNCGVNNNKKEPDLGHKE
jgi:hypothetical protein